MSCNSIHLFQRFHILDVFFHDHFLIFHNHLSSRFCICGVLQKMLENALSTSVLNFLVVAKNIPIWYNLEAKLMKFCG